MTNGDVLAATGNGLVKHFDRSGNLLDTLNTTTASSETTGMCFDSSHNLYVTDFSANTMSKFDSGPNLLTGNFGTGFNANPESCTVDAANNIYVGQADGSTNVLKFDPTGSSLGSFALATDARGTDWIDLASDQCTLYYTSEGSLIKRFNVCTNTQLSDFASGLPGPCFELRIRPNGEVLVACSTEIVRLDSSGTIAQTYPITGSSTLFAMNLDPDNATFWTGDLGNGTVSHVDIATGNILSQFNSSPGTDLAGLSIVGGIVVAQPTLTVAPPTGPSSVGSPYMVTATLTNPGGSVSGQTIAFSVTGANTASGTGATNGSGQATFTYTGTNPGGDTITATFTDSHGTSFTGTATVTWNAVSNPATAVKFANQPNNARVGQVITGTAYNAAGPPVTVDIVDAKGNIVTGSSAPVTVALQSNPGNATLGGTTTVNAVNGVATFSNLTVNKPGLGYTIKATSPSLIGATSSAFDVNTVAVVCQENVNCTGAVGNSSINASITAAFSPNAPDAGVLTLSLNLGPELKCPGFKPQGIGWIYFNVSAITRSKTLVYTIMHPKAGPLSGFQLCYGAPYEFKTKSGAPAKKTVWSNGTVEFVGLLPNCPTTRSSTTTGSTTTGPCITSRTQHTHRTSVTINAFVPAGLPGDPRAHG